MKYEEFFPKTIRSGYFHTGHCQGIAVDKKNRVIYYSFTTQLVKTDFDGKLLGSVGGLRGHLGCIVFNDTDGRVYGSLEYKNDAIGRGILSHIGDTESVENGFYIAIFDGEKITRENMDAEKDGIMRASFLSRVTNDYLGTAQNGRAHIHGCSGIDGTAIGPVPGAKDQTPYLFVAYGVYSETDRADNDYQVLLRYDIADLLRYAKPLSQNAMHKSGAEMKETAYFVYTGNTEYGIQNLEYDSYREVYFLCVYPGHKETFTNAPLFLIDAKTAPKEEILLGNGEERGNVLTLTGDRYGKQQIPSYPCPCGSTGFAALGDGYYYVSYDGYDENGWYTDVRLCKWNGDDPITVIA